MTLGQAGPAWDQLGFNDSTTQEQFEHGEHQLTAARIPKGNAPISNTGKLDSIITWVFIFDER